MAKCVGSVKDSYVRLGKGFGSGLPPGEYLRIISQSVFSVSTRGVGYGTVRYWEIPFAGTTLVSEEPRIWIPNDLEQGKHAFYYSSLKELKRIMTSDLDSETARRMGNEASEFVMRYHSTKVRAKWILGMLKNRYAGRRRSSR